MSQAWHTPVDEAEFGFFQLLGYSAVNVIMIILMIAIVLFVLLMLGVGKIQEKDSARNSKDIRRKKLTILAI